MILPTFSGCLGSESTDILGVAGTLGVAGILGVAGAPGVGGAKSRGEAPIAVIPALGVLNFRCFFGLLLL